MRARRLVIASRNQNKIGEIKELTRGLALQIVGIGELGDFPEIVEDGSTFCANARKKAAVTAQLVQEFVLADDSGLEVDVLGGAPGVQSARFAGANADDAANNQLLLRKLEGVALERRGAQFRCVMALAAPCGEVQFTEGICRGVIVFEPRGAGGFGYDPLFLVPEYGRTFAELGPTIKNRISHRSLAMKDMLKLFKGL